MKMATLVTNVNSLKKLFLKFCKMHKTISNNILTIAKSPNNISNYFFRPRFNNFIRCYAARKRFYKKTNVLYNDGKYEITLDQRKLKTPKGNLFSVESEPLALAVAGEWDAQKTYIVPGKMHLTGLCSTVIDNPDKLVKENLASNIIKYIDTDTILYTSHEEDELYNLQLKEWVPVIRWFCERFDVNIEHSRNISGPKIGNEAKEIILRHLLSYNIWAIHGFNFAVEALKSVILCLSCSERYISVEKAVSLSRLEEEFQGKRWGRIEWSHELNKQDIQARVAAGILFVYFNSSSNLIKNKAQVS